MRPEPRTPISAQARGYLRELWVDLDTAADHLEAIARRIPPALADDVRGGFGKRADRAMGAIGRAIPYPPTYKVRRAAAWRFIRPARNTDRSALVVTGLMLNAAAAQGLTITPFGLTVSHHAVARLLDRTQFRADPTRAVLEAHDALLALRPDEGRRLFALRHFNYRPRAARS